MVRWAEPVGSHSLPGLLTGGPRFFGSPHPPAAVLSMTQMSKSGFDLPAAGGVERRERAEPGGVMKGSASEYWRKKVPPPGGPPPLFSKRARGGWQLFP